MIMAYLRPYFVDVSRLQKLQYAGLYQSIMQINVSVSKCNPRYIYPVEHVDKPESDNHGLILEAHPV